MQGLTETQAQAVFIPFGIGMVVASFVAGSLTDRMPAKPLMVFGGVATAAGVFLATTASPGFAAVVYGIVVGVSVGTIPSITGALLPKWFGIDHIGSIRGVATMFGIGGAALGPLLFSIGNDISDSYEPILVISAGVALAVALLAVLVPTPQPDPLPVPD